jgi:hypothetical protein
LIRYYRKHPQLKDVFQVWPRDASFKTEADAEPMTWPQLAEEMDSGVLLIPVAVPWDLMP